ncbi:MAG TPA: RDD family protein [Ferruginibacter sp.]|nr:RDD family protein [Ferruginibacter sp.]HRE63969.1 RDD family protein [Ferruginibacter sp.]
MAIIQINTVFNIDLEFESAPIHKRILAYGIDFGILIIYLYFMKTLLYEGFDITMSEYYGLDLLVISIPMLLYSLLCEVMMNGQTIGKKITGLRVISLNGGKPTTGQYILRWITKFFEWPVLFGFMMFSANNIIFYIFFTALLGIGVLVIIGLTAKNQRLGDLIANTVLVDTKSKINVHDTVFMDIDSNNYEPSFPQVMRLSDNDINTIKTVLTQAQKSRNYDICFRVESKIKNVLKIESDLYTEDFLKKLLEDYNYLATRE